MRTLTAALAAMAVSLAACSGDDEQSSTEAEQPPQTAAADEAAPTRPGQVVTHPDGRRTITALDGTVIDLDNATPGMHEHLKRKNPPGFDPTKAQWPPPEDPLPEGGPVPIVIHVDAVHKHGLHTTLDLRYTGPLDDVGDFSYTMSLKDPNTLTLSYQRVMVPDGMTRQTFTFMGVPADRVVDFKAELTSVLKADGMYVGDYAKRWKTVVRDERKR